VINVGNSAESGLVGGCAALALSYEKGLCGPVRSGRGTEKNEESPLPNPPPQTGTEQVEESLQDCSASRLALPPTAAVLTLTTCSSAKRRR
jgi:hypothetical protein